MSFTAADVKTLREMTSVGMMDCKKALTECDGDMDKAVEYLREKGLAKAAKKAGRIAAEGMSYALVENGVGALVEVNCETDSGGKIGVLVNLAADVDVTEIGKNVAMQIAALNPRFWDKSQVTEDVLAEEKKIALALMDSDPKMAAKPAQVKEKIVMGKMNKFYEENCLLQMEFVRSDIFQGTVEHYIADAGKKLGGSVKFVNAVRFQTGEGIEKKQEDFAAEVAAQMNMGK